MKDLLFEKGLPCSVPAERFILGSVMLNDELLAMVAAELDLEDFSLEKHRRIFARMRDVANRGDRVDRITLADELMKQGQLESVDGLSYLVSLDDGLPELSNIDSYVRMVKEKSILRKAIFAYQKAINECLAASDPSADILARSEAATRELSSQSGNVGFKSLDQVFHDGGGIAEFINPQPGNSRKVVPTPWPSLNALLAGGGLRPGTMTVIGARPSQGKAQPLTAKVLTLGGFVPMGSLKVGDSLASIDGAESVVTGVFPQGIKQLNTVKFSDGRSTEACDDHLWSITYRHWPGPRIVTTGRLRSMLESKRYRGRLWVARYHGNHGVSADLLIDPWLLGALIGDGGLRGNTPICSNPEPYMIERVRSLIPPDCELVFSDRVTWRIRKRDKRQDGFDRPQRSSISSSLEQYGLLGKFSYEKAIPQCYMDSCRDVRLQLLQGLLDTDGTVGKNGTISFSTTSPKLADQVVELARSLGAVAQIRKRIPHYTYKGQRLEGRDDHRISILCSNGRELVTRPAHAARLGRIKTANPRLTVVSVEPTGKAAAQCISVSHVSNLYVTDDFIITHNTTLGCGLAAHAAYNKIVTPFFTIEMTNSEIMQLMAYSEAGVDSARHSIGMCTQSEKDRLMKAYSVICDRDAFPLFLHDSCNTLNAMRSALIKLRARYEIGLIVVDYVQLMRCAGRSSGTRNDELTVISAGLKGLAKEFDAAMVVLAQLSRGVEKEDRKPQPSDLRDCGALESDADLILMPYTLPRDKQPANWYVELFVDLLIPKQRRGSTGSVPMRFKKTFTRFEEMSR